MATSDGIELEAKALVFATGYELADGVPAHEHHIASTWAFSTERRRRPYGARVS